MMVVVVDIRKPLCIKGKSLQLTFNQKLWGPLLGFMQMVVPKL